MTHEERTIAMNTYPIPSPTGHLAGDTVIASGGEATEPVTATYVGYDPGAGFKPHVVNVRTPTGSVDLHVSRV